MPAIGTKTSPWHSPWLDWFLGIGVIAASERGRAMADLFCKCLGSLLLF